MKRKYNDIMLKSKSFVYVVGHGDFNHVVEKSSQAQQDITSLREELREAKLERGQKVQYDEFTRTMLKKTPKSRTEQLAYNPFYPFPHE